MPWFLILHRINSIIETLETSDLFVYIRYNGHAMIVYLFFLFDCHFSIWGNRKMFWCKMC